MCRKTSAGDSTFAWRWVGRLGRLGRQIDRYRGIINLQPRERAVAAYREALKEQTRERVPLDWARSTGNLEMALMILAQRKRDAAAAEEAVIQIKAARDALASVKH
jgi:hypothetical protein